MWCGVWGGGEITADSSTSRHWVLFSAASARSGGGRGADRCEYSALPFAFSSFAVVLIFFPLPFSSTYSAFLRSPSYLFPPSLTPSVPFSVLIRFLLLYFFSVSHPYLVLPFPSSYPLGVRCERGQGRRGRTGVSLDT